MKASLLAPALLAVFASGCAASAEEDADETGLAAAAAPDSAELAAQKLDAKKFSDLLGLEITTREAVSVAKGTEPSYWPGGRSDWYTLPFDRKLEGQCSVFVTEQNPQPVRYTVPAGTRFRIAYVRPFGAAGQITVLDLRLTEGDSTTFANIGLQCRFIRGNSLGISYGGSPLPLAQTRQYVTVVTMLRTWAFDVKERE